MCQWVVAELATRKLIFSLLLSLRAEFKIFALVRAPIAGSYFITLNISAAVVHLAIAITITLDYMLITKQCA